MPRHLIATLALVLTVGVPATAAEKVGTSTADAPNLQGEFVVHNPTSITLNYQVKWGSKGEWKSYSVRPGYERRHWHPLDSNNKAPTPSVRYDNEGGDGKVTHTEVRMKFGKVGYAGYGPKGYANEAWHYEFMYRTDGKRLDLNEK